jgi:riboflavin biosynthesis pyrimidine reductase
MARRVDPAPLVQVAPVFATIAPDDAERDLRRLYPHPHSRLRLGMIAGADGAATMPDGTSRGLGGSADLRVLRALRAQADAVLVGGRTARVEGYGPLRLPTALASERVALGLPAAPALVIVTMTGDLPPSVGPGSALLLTTRTSPAYAALEDAWGPSIVAAGKHELDLAAGLDALAERGHTRILCEGGPCLATDLLAAGLVDDYCLTTSPVEGDPSGSTVPPVPASMRLAHRLESGPYAIERWVR